MKIKNEYPPNFEKIDNAFKIKHRKTLVFTYGDIVYAPNIKGSIPEHLKVHEKTHIKQQGDDPDGWWGKYIRDEEFRKQQEAQAYSRQYKFYCKKYRGLKKQRKFLQQIAETFAGPTYGNLISVEKAKELIKNTN